MPWASSDCRADSARPAVSGDHGFDLVIAWKKRPILRPLSEQPNTDAGDGIVVSGSTSKRIGSSAQQGGNFKVEFQGIVHEGSYARPVLAS